MNNNNESIFGTYTKKYFFNIVMFVCLFRLIFAGASPIFHWQIADNISSNLGYFF